MALLDAKNEEFKTSVTRGPLHYKSRRLEKVLTGLLACQQDSTDVDKLKYLLKRLTRWQQENPKEFAVRGSKCDLLRAEINTKIRLLGAPPVPHVPIVNIGAMGWVMEKFNEFEKFKAFASGDAFANTSKLENGEPDYRTGFASCIHPDRRAEVRKRNLDLQGTARGAATPFDAKKFEGQWPATNFRMAYQRVVREEAGICITFAKAAAHILTENRIGAKRVEVVSYANHAYVLVNRTDPTILPGRKIPDDWVNDSELIIVDLWAAAMGYDSVYAGHRNGYPYGMVTNLELVATTDEAEE
jgi:hypothetical protein